MCYKNLEKKTESTYVGNISRRNKKKKKTDFTFTDMRAFYCLRYSFVMFPMRVPYTSTSFSLSNTPETIWCSVGSPKISEFSSTLTLCSTKIYRPRKPIAFFVVIVGRFRDPIEKIIAVITRPIYNNKIIIIRVETIIQTVIRWAIVFIRIVNSFELPSVD